MSDRPTKAPSAWWFGVAVVVFALGLVPLALTITNAVDSVVDYEMHDFDSPNSTELEVDDGNVAIFTTHEGVGTIRCNGAAPGADVPDDPGGAAQATVLSLDHPTWSLEYSMGAQTWHRVATTPDDWDEGTYQVACNLVSGDGVDVQPQFAYADNPSILGTFVGIAIAIGIAGLATIAALLIAIVVGVKRSRANRQPLPPGPEFPRTPPPMY